jgi:hypothetical protein
MEEIINLLREKQAEEHDVTHILNLRQKIGEAFRKREAETAINLLNWAMGSLLSLSKEKQKKER